MTAAEGAALNREPDVLQHPTCRYGWSGCPSPPSHHVAMPNSTPKTTGLRMLRLESRPQSSTEKAGVPIADVQRSQLDTPPTSAQPHGIKKKKTTRKATTPANTESHLRDVTFIARDYGRLRRDTYAGIER